MKRIADLTTDECDSVFMRLQHDTKRQILSTILGDDDEIQVYNNNNELRDILQNHIVKWVDAKTFYKLKQCNKAFYQYLGEYPKFAFVRHCYSNTNIKSIPVSRLVLMDVFYDGMLRLYWLLERMKPPQPPQGTSPFQLEEQAREEKQRLEHIAFDRSHLLNFVQRAMMRTLVWCPVFRGHGLVHYPTGIIVKTDGKKARGHIFELNPLHAFQISEYGSIYVKYTSSMSSDEKKQNKILNGLLKSYK